MQKDVFEALGVFCHLHQRTSQSENTFKIYLSKNVVRSIPVEVWLLQLLEDPKKQESTVRHILDSSVYRAMKKYKIDA